MLSRLDMDPLSALVHILAPTEDKCVFNASDLARTFVDLCISLRQDNRERHRLNVDSSKQGHHACSQDDWGNRLFAIRVEPAAPAPSRSERDKLTAPVTALLVTTDPELARLKPGRIADTNRFSGANPLPNDSAAILEVQSILLNKQSYYTNAWDLTEFLLDNPLFHTLHVLLDKHMLSDGLISTRDPTVHRSLLALVPGTESVMEPPWGSFLIYRCHPSLKCPPTRWAVTIGGLHVMLLFNNRLVMNENYHDYHGSDRFLEAFTDKRLHRCAKDVDWLFQEYWPEAPVVEMIYTVDEQLYVTLDVLDIEGLKKDLPKVVAGRDARYLLDGEVCRPSDHPFLNLRTPLPANPAYDALAATADLPKHVGTCWGENGFLEGSVIGHSVRKHTDEAAKVTYISYLWVYLHELKKALDMGHDVSRILDQACEDKVINADGNIIGVDQRAIRKGPFVGFAVSVADSGMDARKTVEVPESVFNKLTALLTELTLGQTVKNVTE